MSLPLSTLTMDMGLTGFDCKSMYIGKHAEGLVQALYNQQAQILTGNNSYALAA